MEIEAPIRALPTANPRLQRDHFSIGIGNAFYQFLSQFVLASVNAQGQLVDEKTYVQQMIALTSDDTKATNDTTNLFIDYQHMVDYDGEQEDRHVGYVPLAPMIKGDYLRVEKQLCEALFRLAKEVRPSIVEPNEEKQREFYPSFFNIDILDKIRDLKTDRIGQLTCVSGTVTRTSEVRPELVNGTFTCLECTAEIPNIEQQFKYTEPSICSNGACANRTKFHLVVSKSKFVDWQKIRVQENSSEIPSGSMPRTIEVILRHETVERAKPGDRCIFSGSLIVVPDVAQLMKGTQMSTRASGGREGHASEGVSGLKELGVKDLTYKLAFLACTVQPANARMGMTNIREDAMLNDPISFGVESDAQIPREILEMKNRTDNAQRMIRTIAPTVFGHDEIKRGILLMLFGGVHKQTLEGINLRGDINVCVVGDPSTAKSQFLKYVVDFLPRAVYASGKGSSAAGLTVSVVKDDETNEFCIEAGALMLADNGICCIDEFDKMDVKDQVAIHEAMEQQTISIAKAGINATLNARTSILAAANPSGGRYDKSKSLRTNVAMSPAIMSRFDLFFVVLDECNEVADYNIARHIVNIHQRGDTELPLDTGRYTMEQLQSYIKFARRYKPTIPVESQRLMARYYRDLRVGDTSGGGAGAGATGRASYRITPRQLESLVRLSEAIARLHLSPEIKPAYVTEAYQLLRTSIIHVDSEDVEFDEELLREVEAAERREKGLPELQEEEDVQDKTDSDKKEEKRKVTITWEKYQKIAHSVIRELRRREEELLEDEVKSLTRSELADWYLDQQDINTEEELYQENDVFLKVIHRLVTKDKVLLELSTAQFAGEGEAEAEAEDEEQKRLELFVHPNYVMGDGDSV